MRFLASENLPRVAVEALRVAGHDVAWVRTEGPGATDQAVLEWARRHDRVLLTFDKDFGELVLRRGTEASPGIVLFRIPAERPAEVARRRDAGKRGNWGSGSGRSDSGSTWRSGPGIATILAMAPRRYLENLRDASVPFASLDSVDRLAALPDDERARLHASLRAAEAETAAGLAVSAGDTTAAAHCHPRPGLPKPELGAPVPEHL